MSPAEMLERLAADEIQAALGSAVIGREIIVLDQTGSTNDASCKSRRQIQVRAWFYLPNTKRLAADNEVIVGNRRRQKDFGSRFCCDRGSR